MNRHHLTRLRFLSVSGFILAAAILFACESKSVKNDYLPLIIELHSIECSQLNKHNVQYAVNEKNIYGFKSVAFDLMFTKSPDARLIARYEEISNKLADYERYLEEDDKDEYIEEYNKIYTSECSSPLK